MKSINRKLWFAVFSFFTFFLVVIGSSIFSTMTVHAHSGIYSFELHYRANSSSSISDQFSKLIFEGDNIDFITFYYDLIDSNGNRMYYAEFYALSLNPFTCFIDGYSIINDKPSRFTSGTFKSNEIEYNNQIFYEYTDRYPAFSIDQLSGFPNVIYLGSFNVGDYIIDKDSLYENFVTNGGLDWENGLSPDGVYDESLPIIDKLKYSVITSAYNCHGNAVQNGCFNLSWNKPDGITKNDLLEIRVSANYNYSTYWGTKRFYSSGFFDYSKIYGFIPVTNLSSDFCVSDFISYINIDDLNGLTLLPQKIYIRIIRDVSGNRSYGDWVVYDVNRNILNTPSIGKGEVIPGDSEFDDLGNYLEDSKGTIDPPGDNNSSFSLDFTDVSSVLKTFKNIIEDLIATLGTFPSMFSSVFSFLPAPFLNAIYLVLIVAIIIGILKIFT